VLCLSSGWNALADTHSCMHIIMCLACAAQLQLMCQHQSASKHMRGIRVKQEPQAHAYLYVPVAINAARQTEARSSQHECMHECLCAVCLNSLASQQLCRQGKPAAVKGCAVELHPPAYVLSRCGTGDTDSSSSTSEEAKCVVCTHS
jgi:hypothetical protein